MAANLLFSKDQIKEIREKFSTFVTDGNSTISKELLVPALIEVGQYLTQTTEEDSSSGLNQVLEFTFEREFKVEETIEFSEFLTMVAEQTTYTATMRPYYTAFFAVDTNRDRALSEAELRKALSTTDPPMKEEDIDALIKKAGLNEAGKIDLTAFVRVIQDSFLPQ
ncbi:calcium-binding protein SPEC 2C [Strongylocentrotus purpuratus]|uniref:EF-hand domain-containing protein n=1 Tax=Strongylocentrotus purpuratus TaxID=7668 RepID=A0A7M7NH45_STRPU|nr:calcium-binding protein SPEC 2C [Strongylocentrotus purpuratus]